MGAHACRMCAHHAACVCDGMLTTVDMYIHVCRRSQVVTDGFHAVNRVSVALVLVP